MILEVIYKWLQTQEKSFVYHIRSNGWTTLMGYQVSFDGTDKKPVDIKVGDRVYLLDGRGKRRHGSLIIKDVIFKIETFGSEKVKTKYAVFSVPIHIGISAACNDDKALIVRTSDTVVMLRKIINYVLNGESNV